MGVGQFDSDDRRWMHRALELADIAESEGEVPVGALVVRDVEDEETEKPEPGIHVVENWVAAAGG